MKLTCSAPLPTLFASHPPRPDAPRLQEAAASLHEFLSIRTAASDIDSLSIAVVTPAGPIFEHGYGVLRANETSPEKRGSVTRDSIYRIASITKMFTVLETLILRERGALSWSVRLVLVVCSLFSTSSFQGRSCHQISPEFYSSIFWVVRFPPRRLCLGQFTDHLASTGQSPFRFGQRLSSGGRWRALASPFTCGGQGR